MPLYSKFNQFFGFTPTESKVVFFLLITFLVGGAVKLSRMYFLPDPPARFDYTEAEEAFTARSRAIDSLESGRLGQQTGYIENQRRFDGLHYFWTLVLRVLLGKAE